MRIINIDTPTWPLPTNTNVLKHTQNSGSLVLCDNNTGIYTQHLVNIMNYRTVYLHTLYRHVFTNVNTYPIKK